MSPIPPPSLPPSTFSALTPPLRRLATLSAQLRHSATSPSTPYLLPAPAPTHTPRTDLPDLVKAKWNASLAGLVRALETADTARIARQAGALGGAALGEVQGLVQRLGQQAGDKVDEVERRVEGAVAGAAGTANGTGAPMLAPRRAHNDTLVPANDVGGVLGSNVHTGIGMSPGGSEVGVMTNLGSKRLV